ncbi:hypothetical protein AB6A40_009170 [Gnathostoma spinigerum]|uniref:non-specific protein-tyrosine kinase n=1 Tax=Gnathostoma spinigerum TaxID=75299 RepID=A0ABD6ERH9_9BILA
MAADQNLSLSELLREADLSRYESAMMTVLKLRTASDVLYTDEKDLTGIGMSRPEQKKLRATYHSLFHKDSLVGKLRRKILGKGDTKKIEQPQQADQDQHIISSEHITLCRELGKGEFGCVYQAVWNMNGSSSQIFQVAYSWSSDTQVFIRQFLSLGMFNFTRIFYSYF